MKRYAWVLPCVLVLTAIGARLMQYPNPSPSTFDPPDMGWLVNWYHIPPGGAYLPDLYYGQLYPLPTNALNIPETPDNQWQCPAVSANTTVRTPLATYHLRRTRHGCVGVPVPNVMLGIFTNLHIDQNWKTYWGQAAEPGGATGRTGADSYIAPFWPVVDGGTISLGGDNQNPIIACPRLEGPASEVPSAYYRFLLEGGSLSGIATLHTAHASYRGENGNDCVRYGCDEWRKGWLIHVLQGVFAPAANAPNFLLVHTGGGESANQKPPRQIVGLAVYPDCGDNNTYFPPTCIAAHANPTGGNWGGGDVFRDDDRFGYLGQGVSTELILRPLVLGWKANGEDVYPSKFAIRFSSPSPNVSNGRKWPLPPSMQESTDRWMSVWHASRWTKLHDGDARYRGASEILRWIPTNTSLQEVADYSTQAAHHPLALRGFWGKGEVGQHSIIDLDVRGISQRGADTMDDGLEVWNEGQWRSPEAVTLTMGISHTFRVTLRVPQGVGGNGSVDVWAAHIPVTSTTPLFNRVASFAVSPGAGTRQFTFVYRPPIVNNRQVHLRVIYRVGLPSPTGNFPTVSGSPPYISAISCVPPYTCDGPAVEPIAEPFVVAYNHHIPTGEVEDYIVSLRPALVFRGRTYAVADDSPLPGVPVTLTTPGETLVQYTGSDGRYEFWPTVIVPGQYRITAPFLVGDLALWETGPGETRTDNRPPYILETNLGVFTYTFATLPYGEYNENNFGYGTGEVSGAFRNLISGRPIPSAPITLTIAPVVSGTDTCLWDAGVVSTTLANGSGVFRFVLQDQREWWPITKCVRLTFPYTITLSGGTVVTHASHTPGVPEGAVEGLETVLRLGARKIINWHENIGYYYGLRVDIIREHPVVPTNPDSLTPLLTPLRQAVTTTCEFADSDGSWYPLETGTQEVYLRLVITTEPPQRYFYPACSDDQPACRLDLCVRSGSNCVESRPLGGRYVFFASEPIGTVASPPILPYRLFAITPGHDSARATWHVYWRGADGEDYDAILETNTVEWDVVGAVFRRRE